MKYWWLIWTFSGFIEFCAAQSGIVTSFPSDASNSKIPGIRENGFDFISIQDPTTFIPRIIDEFDRRSRKLYYCQVDSVFTVYSYTNDDRSEPDSTGMATISRVSLNLVFYNRESKVTYHFWSEINPIVDSVTVEGIMLVSTQVLIDVSDSANAKMGRITISRNRNRTRFVYPYFSYYEGTKQNLAGKRIEIPIHSDLFLTTDLRVIVGYMRQLDEAWSEN